MTKTSLSALTPLNISTAPKRVPNICVLQWKPKTWHSSWTPLA